LIDAAANAGWEQVLEGIIEEYEKQSGKKTKVLK
jgi:hypothetical protein